MHAAISEKVLPMIARPRRNRKSHAIRSLLKETILSSKDFVMPFFLLEGNNRSEPINSLPDICRLSSDLILREAETFHAQGIQAIALFPVISSEYKCPNGKEASNPNGILPEAIRLIKKEIPSLCIITDIALDPYTSHGHDGIISPSGEVLNDPTLEILAEMALVQAEAGADYVAPSDMMDGRVRHIRNQLDEQGFTNTGILSYSAKYASSLYSPFRDALHSQLQFGDKKTYQMDFANAREALWEAELDDCEGADILMVKPATFYLDIIAKIRARIHKPLCAYHVSGEYAMVMAAEEKGFLNATSVFYEALLGIKRAGADFIFSYAVPKILPILEN